VSCEHGNCITRNKSPSRGRAGLFPKAKRVFHDTAAFDATDAHSLAYGFFLAARTAGLFIRLGMWDGSFGAVIKKGWRPHGRLGWALA
jgi:hypothetical protein